MSIPNLINWLYALLINPYIFYDESQCSVVLTSLLSKNFFIEYIIELVLLHGFTTSLTNEMEDFVLRKKEMEDSIIVVFGV